MTKKRPAKRDMTYYDLLQGYVDKGYELQWYGSVKEPVRGKDEYYRLYKMILNPEYKKTLLITTGFHGEEFNGPISLLHIMDEVAAFAKEMGVRLLVYPCINPSGFDLHQRYNPTDDLGGNGNNDWMRYEIEKGRWVGTLLPGEPFVKYKIIDSAAKEVRLLKRDIQKYPLPKATWDAHQQEKNLDLGNIYAYVLNQKQRPIYRRIINKLEKIPGVKAARNDSWTDTVDGREINCLIDKDGLYFLHDGSITDMFHQLGSEFNVCTETKTNMPLETVCQVHLTWGKELIKLAAK